MEAFVRDSKVSWSAFGRRGGDGVCLKDVLDRGVVVVVKVRWERRGRRRRRRRRVGGRMFGWDCWDEVVVGVGVAGWDEDL